MLVLTYRVVPRRMRVFAADCESDSTNVKFCKFKSFGAIRPFQ
jgi:hypothetical protein